jgi:hypothetical protein
MFVTGLISMKSKSSESAPAKLAVASIILTLAVVAPDAR